MGHRAGEYKFLNETVFVPEANLYKLRVVKEIYFLIPLGTAIAE